MRHRRRAGRCADARRGRLHPPRRSRSTATWSRARPAKRASLRELGAGIIVGDIPPLAFAVGASAGIPSIGLGNFTWDWVYADYPRVRLAPSLLPAIRGAYAKASMALRLPMSGGFESFSNVKRHPVHRAPRVAARAKRSARLLKLPADKPFVLASFGGYGLPGLDTEALASSRSTRSSPPRTVPLEPRAQGCRPRPSGRDRSSASTRRRCTTPGVRYEDLVGAAEAVVTKPGYGIISGVHRQRRRDPLHVTRPLSRNTTSSSRRCRSIVRNAFISHDDLFAGKWESHLDKLLAQAKPKKKPETNGAEVAADILLKALDKPPKKPRGRPKAKFWSSAGSAAQPRRQRRGRPCTRLLVSQHTIVPDGRGEAMKIDIGRSSGAASISAAMSASVNRPCVRNGSTASGDFGRAQISFGSRPLIAVRTMVCSHTMDASAATAQTR